MSRTLTVSRISPVGRRFHAAAVGSTARFTFVSNGSGGSGPLALALHNPCSTSTFFRNLFVGTLPVNRELNRQVGEIQQSWFSTKKDETNGKENNKGKNEDETKLPEVVGETDPDTATGVNRTLIMNPNGSSRLILPGGYAMKKNPKTGTERKIWAERVLGSFWMLKDLEKTDKKPILANPAVIPAEEAQLFPSLGGVGASGDVLPATLSGNATELPGYLFRNNRAEDPTSQCTLVTVSYKAFGYNMIPSWIEPFKQALCGPDSPRTNRVEVVRLSIQEGMIYRWLKPLIKNGFIKEVSEGDHDNVLLYFGDDQHFKDAIRVHNTATGYVFLLDGIGRIRWAGSGVATDAELRLLVNAAKELTPTSNKSNGNNKVRGAGSSTQKRGRRR